MNSFLKELIGTRNADGTLERKDGDVDQSREERRRRRRQRRANLSMFQSLNTRTRTLRWIILVDLFLLSLTSLEIFTSDIRVVSFGKAKSVIVVMVTMILIGIGFNGTYNCEPINVLICSIGFSLLCFYKLFTVAFRAEFIQSLCIHIPHYIVIGCGFTFSITMYCQ